MHVDLMWRRSHAVSLDVMASAAAILSDNSSGELYSVTGRLPLLHMNLKIVCMHNMTCRVSFGGGHLP